MTDVKKDVENKVAVKEHDNRCESYEKYMEVCYKTRKPTTGKCRDVEWYHGRKSKELRYCMRGLYETACRWQCVKVIDKPGVKDNTKNTTDKDTNEK
jgi:hypothetical protein